MKRSIISFFSAAVLASLLFTSCKPADARTLYSRAKRDYGSCTVVSKTVDGDNTTLVLHDDLQGFDYTVSSSMEAIYIDGSNFGSVPSSDDTFKVDLKKHVLSVTAPALDAACSGDNVRYEQPKYLGDGDDILIIRAENGDAGNKAALVCAAAIQEQNLNSRLDGVCIRVYADNEEDYWADENYGSVKLPDIVFRTPEDERVDYYTEMAHMQTDPKAKYLRKEKGRFSDTGAELRRVVNVMGSDIPTSPDSPVTFYYFESSDGTEYYLCDFNYYDEDHSGFAWYTNYSGKKGG
ncbi:MAG: hypothetical protein K6G68_11900 [Oscillospiraceae bacterium]|nr:hypothetical protein [Oscillospiraceae bacterium]